MESCTELAAIATTSIIGVKGFRVESGQRAARPHWAVSAAEWAVLRSPMTGMESASPLGRLQSSWLACPRPY